MNRYITAFVILISQTIAGLASELPVSDSSPLIEKAKFFQEDLINKHLLEGLYVSITRSAPHGTKLTHTVNDGGNVIHAGVWTGRYLAGVGYQYAVTRDPWVREHGEELLQGLRKLQEVTGKPGLLARGFVRGHGPVRGWEQGFRDSKEWHQGQGKYADYRFYGDVSVDNFNAVLYGYAVYYDLAATEEQKKFIAYDTDRLMTHLLDNHCRIIDVDGEVTRYGFVGIDPDPAHDEFYRNRFAGLLRRFNQGSREYKPSLRSNLMLLPDLLIAHHITGKKRYIDTYDRIIKRFKDNPDPFSQIRRMMGSRFVDHSSEGQSYEALYNLIRYARDPELAARYGKWAEELWDANWSEGNSLFTYMTLAMLPEYRGPSSPGVSRAEPGAVPHGPEALKLALQTLEQFPVDRRLKPVMNSIRTDIEIESLPGRRGRKQAKTPLPINQRPHDNEYEWKGNPYRLDGWLKPTLTGLWWSCDDPLVGWFTDSAGRLYRTLDMGKSWDEMTPNMRGPRVQAIAVSPTRTFVLHAKTNEGVFITRDGGLSWQPAGDKDIPEFTSNNPNEWQSIGNMQVKINDKNQLVRRAGEDGQEAVCMDGWRVPIARNVLVTKSGVLASGPGGVYHSTDLKNWTEKSFWEEQETGACDFLQAYWMGRYYGFLKE